MHYYLDIQEQITNIMKKFTSNDLKHQSNDSNLTDKRDGSIYKEFSNAEEDKGQNAFSLFIDTDGISIAKNSKLTCWPIYFVINELPIEHRHTSVPTFLFGIGYWV
jgi:hypothetical protein